VLDLSIKNHQKRICFLNVEEGEMIRSIYFNKENDSLITVSVYRSDGYVCPRHIYIYIYI